MTRLGLESFLQNLQMYNSALIYTESITTSLWFLQTLCLVTNTGTFADTDKHFPFLGAIFPLAVPPSGVMLAFQDQGFYLTVR